MDETRVVELEGALRESFEALSKVATSLKGIFEVYHQDEWEHLEDETKDGVIIDDAMAKIAPVIGLQFVPIFTEEDRAFITTIEWPDDSWMDEEWTDEDEDLYENDTDILL
jgi:hypothetical protein